MLFEEYREEGDYKKLKFIDILVIDQIQVEYIDTFEYEDKICLLTEFMGIDLLDALNIYDTINEIP